MSVLVQCRSVSKWLGNVPVLRQIDLTVQSGEMLVIVGPNGSGKSTLMRILAGMLSCTQGVVMRGGRVITAGGAPDRGLGYLTPESFFYDGLTLWQNLALYARLWGIADWAARATAAIDRVGLGYAAHETLACYSRGMRQRAGWARLWLQAPRLWILDEPFAGLDQYAREMTRSLLDQTLAAGAGVVVALPHPEAGLLAGALLQRGRLLPIAEADRQMGPRPWAR